MKAKHRSSHLAWCCFLWLLKVSNLALSNRVHPPYTSQPYLAAIELAKTVGTTVQPPTQVKSHLLDLVRLALYSVYLRLDQMSLLYAVFSLFKTDAHL